MNYQQPYYCISDFIAPKDSNLEDHIGLFAVTAGLGADVLCQQYVDTFAYTVGLKNACNSVSIWGGNLTYKWIIIVNIGLISKKMYWIGTEDVKN